MAKLAQRLSENVAGDFYVDASCIDCDACRQIAPTVFRDHGDQSSVYHQPANDEEVRRALMSIVACPTASIGTTNGRYDKRVGVEAFPELVADDVYFCGFTAEHSFGAWSYLIVRPQERGGNVLVDSPRYASHLVRRIEALGGLNLIFLTHKDDVADQARYAARFHASRIMHADDNAARHGVEQIVEGTQPVRLDDELTIIPTPGHTRGHVVLLYRDRFLFTGDHLAWSPARASLTAFRSVCWYSWTEQTRSMARLLNYHFEWVLPGHGRIHHAPTAEMHAHLKHCVEWMKGAK